MLVCTSVFVCLCIHVRFAYTDVVKDGMLFWHLKLGSSRRTCGSRAADVAASVKAAIMQGWIDAARVYVSVCGSGFYIIGR